VEVSGVWSPAALRLSIQVEDDKPANDRDRLMVGVALENSDLAHEVVLRDGPQGPLVERAFDGDGPPEGWQVQSDAPEGGRRTWNLSIPAAAFGVDSFTAERHVLLAVRYVDDDGGRTQPQSLAWGSGLDGGRSSRGYVWVRLAP
jgi:hypothetical protein